MNAAIDVTGVEIETPRLLLRAWKQEDLADFYEYARVDGVGHGGTGVVEAVGVAEHGGGVAAAAIQAGDGIQLGVQNLHVLVNLDAAQGTVAAGEVTGT